MYLKKPFGLIPQLCIACLIFLFSACSSEKLLLIVNVPGNTPAEENIYITGSFNNWNPADPAYQLEFDAALHSYSISLPESVKEGAYLYARGNNNSIESDACGNRILARKLSSVTTQIDTIEGWMDIAAVNCTQHTFIIQADSGLMPDNETIYLATAASNWKAGNAEYLFQQQENGTYSLTLFQNTHQVLFNLFRGNRQQFDTAQLIPSHDDTTMLTLAISLPVTPVTAKPVAKQEAWLTPSKPTEKTVEKVLPQASPQTITIDKPKPIQVVAATMPTPAPTIVEVPKTKPQPEPVKNPEANKPQVAPKVTPPVVAEKKVVDSDTRKKIFVIIDKLPSFGKSDELYLAADFNDWNIADPNYQFRSLPNGKKYLLLRLNDSKSHDFKITRGEAGTDEANYKEEAVDFHEIEKGEADDTIHVRIDSWLDAYPRKRIVVYLVDVPENTPERDDIYLTGDFNKWKLDDDNYKFTALGDYAYALTIDDFSKFYNQFKISRGSWETEAVARNGRVPGAQRFELIHKDTMRLRIEQWKDLKNRK